MTSFTQGKWLLVVHGIPATKILTKWVNHLEHSHRGEPKGILLLAPRASSLLHRLAVEDWRLLISSGRLMFATGPEWETTLDSLWRDHALATLEPTQFDFVDLASEAAPFPIIERIHTTKRESYFALLRECEQYWSSPARPIQRVWTHTNDDRASGGILMSFVEGFAGAGVRARTFYCSDSLFTRFYRCALDFFHEKPDLMVCINHSSNYVASFAEPVPIPRLVYYVDHPDRTVEVPFHPHDRVIGVSETFRHAVERRGGSFLGEIPVAAPAHMAPPRNIHHPEQKITYVGSVTDTRPLWNRIPASIRDWMEAVVNAQLSHPTAPMMELMDNNPLDAKQHSMLISIVRAHQPKAHFMSDERLLEYTLYVESNSRRRVQALSSLAEQVPLEIYGPPDWWTRPDTQPIRTKYRHPVSSAHDLKHLYAESTINLSINSLQGFGFVNQRLFEVPAAGGFLLAEQVPGMEAVFQRDHEMAWFETWEDMRNQIEHWLDRDNERHEMILRAQRRMQQEHTYTQRATTALQWLKKETGSNA